MKYTKLTYSLVILAIAALPLLFSDAAYAALPQCSSGSNTAICQANTSLVGGVLKSVINVLLYFAGTIAVIVIVVGGIRYITSDGDPGAASKAKNTIIYALVGLVVAVMAYAIVNFILDRI